MNSESLHIEPRTVEPLVEGWKLVKKGMDADAIRLSFAAHLEYSIAKDRFTATERDLFQALALSVRDRLIERWIRTQQEYYSKNAKRVYYLSAEYLMGRLLLTNLINLGIWRETRKALAPSGIELTDMFEQEPDAGLGNGGLGRLAACFLDSMATLEIPAYGYGIRYEFGIFEQAIRDGCQVELPDEWLKNGNPWELKRPERSYVVRFFGQVESKKGPAGGWSFEWVNTQDVKGVAYDTPIVGYKNDTVNTLRLWSSHATEEFDLEYFQDGDYLKAVEQKNISENISKVLYPDDSSAAGRELRLQQQYFFVSCSLQDMIRRFLVRDSDFEHFPDHAAIQLNDTHPALAIPELMRLLMDEHGLGWEQAWDITTRTIAYTNHTLLAEALEKWSVALFGRLLPRHLQIVYEINRRFLRDVAVTYPDEPERMKRMSIVQDEGYRSIRMAHLSVIGAHSVNGVSGLHTDLLKNRVLRDFNDLWPERFNNKTNGVTPRRWLLGCNPGLARLITDQLGDGWVRHLEQLSGFEASVTDSALRERFLAIKRANKERLSGVIAEVVGVQLDPASIFDVQVKRIHEYKRQLLNVLHIVATWLKLKQGIAGDFHPRSYLIGGKAAPGYFRAKEIIRLVNHVAIMLNRDPTTRDRLRVVYIPNYRVSLAEAIIPATDTSVQISTAGFEASGTGNMKFMMNGALTVGTLDGANVEIHQAVGDENMYVFGMTVDDVARLGLGYRPRTFYEGSPLLREALDLIKRGFFNMEDPDLFRPIIEDLLTTDQYMVLADFQSYMSVQERISSDFADSQAWSRRAMTNVARSGVFSSDRTIAQYNDEIWRAGRCPVDIDTPAPGYGETNGKGAR